jgi:hypothetical protein
MAQRSVLKPCSMIVVAVATGCFAGCAKNEGAPSDPSMDAVISQLQGELDATAAVNPSSQPLRNVKPVLKCVEKLSSSQYRAHFGYANRNTTSVNIPVGFHNRFWPPPINRGQPTTFPVGTQPDVLQLTFSAYSISVWILGTSLEFATRNSKACPTGTGGAGGDGGNAGNGGAGGLGGGCPSNCDDGNPCTLSVCNESTKFLCTFVPLRSGSSCSDGNACTIGDTCQPDASGAGISCMPGAPRICTAIDQCHAAGTCDEATGVCTSPTVANGTACSDGNVCTVADSCLAGVCQGVFPECGPCSACPSTCNACAAANCTSETDGCAEIADPADRLLCQRILGCFFSSGCVGPQGNTFRCWCGTSLTTCTTDNIGPTKANGPCLDLVTQGAGLTAATYDAATITRNFLNPAFPLGRADNLVLCEGNFCSLECHLP